MRQIGRARWLPIFAAAAVVIVPVLPLARAVPSPASASPTAASPSTVFVPAAAHATGANGANWRTDLEVHNPGTTTASFAIALLERDKDNAAARTKSYTLAARQSRRFADVLLGEFAFEGAAALRVSVSSGSVVVTSRTYNLVGTNPWKLPVGASFSQYVPGWDESAAIEYGQEGRLIHLAQQPSSSLDGFRTNIGLVNATTGPIGVRVDLYRANGTWLGKDELGLPALGFRQLTEVFASWGTIPDAYAVVRTTTAGGRLLAFATVIDNHNSGDPVFIPAAVVAVSGGATPTPTPTPTRTPSPTPTRTPSPTPTRTAAPSAVDLVPYKPTGWQNPVVPDSQAGSLSTNFLSAHMTTYVRWAVVNNGTADIPGVIRFELRIDGAPFARWRDDDGLRAGYYTYVTDYPIPYDTVTPGMHTLTIVADYDNEIPESNEANNSWGKSWEWTAILFVQAGDEAAAPRSEASLIEELPLPAALPVEATLPHLAPLAAAPGPVYVPASAHATGLNGASWRTDLEVHNPGTTAASFTITLLRQDTDNSTGTPSKPFSLGPQQSVRYVDVLSSLFAFTGAAAIRVTPQSGTILVNSRTYNLIGPNSAGLPVGASFGQFVPALAETDAIGAGQEGRIIQLSHGDPASLNGFRSNVGYVNATGSPIDLRIDLHKADGTLLGTIQDARTHLRAWEFKQINGVFGAFASSLADGYAVVRTTTPAGRFFAFATVIDNHLTGDPICIPAARLGASTAPTPTPTPSATATPTPGSVSVAISPGAVTLGPGGRQTFRAVVVGSSNTAVKWTVAEGATGGAVDSAGAYTAPSSAGVYHVVATSQADGTKRDQATVVVSTTPVDPAFGPQPVVAPASTTLTNEGTVPANTKGAVSLTDGTRVDVPAIPGPVQVSLTRSPAKVDAVRVSGQDPTGTARLVTYSGDEAALDFVPTVTIPKADAGTVSALNVARIGPAVVNGTLRNDVVVFLPVTRDSGGNLVFRDVLLRHAARLAPSSTASTSALGIVKSVTAIYTLSTYQGQLNWAIEPQLIRMVPSKTDAARRTPLASLTAKEREEVLRKPIQNVVVLVHGHNEAERFGNEKTEIPSIWGYEYKRDAWTLLYEKFQASYAAYADCTAFYEFVYPTYRPVFAGSGALGASLAKLLAEDEKLKKQTAKYNLMFVAHSMGGLVARSAINQLSSAVAPNFEKLVTWGSPHHGSPVVTFRYLLTSGYNLYVPGMCATGSTLPLTAFNQFGLYRGAVQAEGAVDTPGERELRWDNSKPLDLQGIGWRRATWQEGDDARWDPDRNPDLYNAPLLAFNKSDKYYLSAKYVALYGLTSQLAPIDVTSCTSLVSFVRAKAIPQGAGINRWIYNNASTLDAYPGKPAVKLSDGAVPVDSMVGLGVFSAFNTYSLGDTDHEQYYGAPKGGAFTAKEKGDATATSTLYSLQLKEATNKKCDCPAIEVTSLQTSGTNKLVAGKVVWPGDSAPGKRVLRIALVRVVSGSRTVTAASPFAVRDDGSFDATFPASLFEGATEAPAIAAVLKDGGELSVPAMQLVRVTLTYPGRTIADLRWPQPAMTIEAGVEAERVKLLSKEGCCTARLLVQGSGLNVKHNLWFRIVKIDPAGFFPAELCSSSTCRRAEWVGFTKATSSPFFGETKTITSISATLRWDGVEIGQGVTDPIATGFAPHFKMNLKEWDKGTGTVCTDPLFCPPSMEDYFPFRIELVTKE